MNLERLRWGEWIAVISAADLLLVTFRAWYKVTGTDAHVTAWDALEQGRYLLIATAVVGIFLFLIQAAEDTQRMSFPPGWIAAIVGLACTVYIAYRLATPPSDALDPALGLFLGLASALGVAIGGLISAREPAPGYEAPDVAGEPAAGAAEPGAPADQPAETWSPAAPAASTSGWSPASPAAPGVPPATAAGAGEQRVRAGESVVLTAGGSRFPAGTVASVVEAFPGGALVEVRAPDGMAERFEVPESAYEPAVGGAGAAAAAAAGEGWSPAMPAAATEDWGFEESSGGATTAWPDAEGAGAEAESKSAKVPWWKREIGGGKKKSENGDAGLAAAGAASALGGAAAVEAAESNGAGEEKPGFFKRLFGGGAKKEGTETDALEPDEEPESVVGETPPIEPEPEPEPEPAEPEPEPEPVASEPEAPAVDPEPEPEPIAPAPEPAAAEAEAEASASAPEAAAAEPDPEPEPIASTPEAPAPDPEPEPAPPASPREPESAGETGGGTGASEPAEAAAESAALSDTETPSDLAPTPEPTPEPGRDVSAGASAAAGAAAGSAAAASNRATGEPEPTASEPDVEPAAEEPAPKRRRSSGSRKVPKEALTAAAAEAQPKVGDEVQLKVGGGKYDAGTKGTVVDVFSAGVIVELSDDEGRTDRLDLPFEAIGPADA